MYGVQREEVPLRRNLRWHKSAPINSCSAAPFIPPPLQLVERGIIEDVFSLCFGYPKDGILLLGETRGHRKRETKVVSGGGWRGTYFHTPLTTNILMKDQVSPC